MVRMVAEMGEIRVDVTLSNAVDEGIARRGGMSMEEVRQDTVEAIVDTGAVRSCIPAALAQKLGLEVTERMSVELADGNSQVVGLTEPIRFQLLDRSTTEQAWVLGNEVLIGQTVLETTDLLADCGNQRLIPNPEHPDGPVLKVKSVIGGL
ncbi:MAG: retroviral-like aspartic protease family protein [Planctomycetales bacterium]|nr:retroviral-like aspartic protease family protein [Planctomycetales bacterium]